MIKKTPATTCPVLVVRTAGRDLIRAIDFQDTAVAYRNEYVARIRAKYPDHRLTFESEIPDN